MKNNLVRLSTGFVFVSTIAAGIAFAQSPTPVASPAAVAPVAAPASPAVPPSGQPAQANTTATATATAAPAPTAAPVTTAAPAPAPAVTPQRAAKMMTGYRYSFSECEYSLELPEAPQAKSIWAGEEAPDFEANSSLGVVGEQANYKRMEWQTKDFLNVEITCVRVTPEFLKAQTSAKMFDYLESQFKDVSFENKKKNFSPGAQTLSWATIAGYEFDKNKKMIYNIGHYLTGLKSAMIIKIQFVADNPTFAEQYKMIDQSITLNKN